jgi:heat shock protein HslJ
MQKSTRFFVYFFNRLEAYLTALQAATGFEITGPSLAIKGPSGETLAVFNGQDTGLADTSWFVTGYNNGSEAVVSVLPGTEITATFDEDGQVTGSAGCNNYFAPYETDGDMIEIGPMGATKSKCQEPEGVMEQESRYLAALETADIYSMSGNRMELRTTEGSLAASFQRARGQ